MPQQDVIQIVEYGTWERWLEARECGLHVLASVLGKTMLRLDSDLGEDVNGGGRWMATWPAETKYSSSQNAGMATSEILIRAHETSRKVELGYQDEQDDEQ
ncbi:hypothetical protein HPP92_008043 [Vanilla planifolia]|uniref:Uncharacterized protein n=1 Tax=Vanilla planifolia TaxID=51239 RepID=A0A835RF68_VANPL|nr:hypothetical protein HPP92_008043 [Vanilla planifolia]